MNKTIVYFFLIFIFFNPSVKAKENFFDEALSLFNEKKFEDSKFLFQRNIVFNPKHAKSYLYLAKIYKNEDNEKEELKNLNTTLLLEPDNEEAIYMIINLELSRSNFSKVKELTENLKIVCKSLCNKTDTIYERLKDIELND